MKRSNTIMVSTYTVLFSIGIFVCFLIFNRFQSNLIEKVLQGHATQLATTLEEVRSLYTADVVSAAKHSGMSIVHDYKMRENSIPLPATFSMTLGHKISQRLSGGNTRLYSDFPFPWRKNEGGIKDHFEQKAIQLFRNSDKSSYSEITTLNGVPSFRFAIPDRMRASCVDCHNSHPQTPKSNWKEGDVRGVLEVSLPVQSIEQDVNEMLTKVWLTLGVFLILCVSLLLLYGKKILRQTQEISVQERQLAVEKEYNMQLNREKEETLKITEELILRDAQMSSIVESAAEGILTVDHEDYTVTTFNPAAEAMFSQKMVNVLNTKLSALMPEEVNIEAYLEQHLNDGDVKSDFELMGLRADGTSFPIQVSVGHYQDHDKTNFTLLIRDLTQAKKIENKLLQAQKMESIGQLAAGVAHEINTPTQYVKDNVEFLQPAVETFSDIVQSVQKWLSQQSVNDDKDLTRLNKLIADSDIEFLIEESPLALEQSIEGLLRISKIVGAMKSFSHTNDAQMQLTNLNEAIEATITLSRNEWRYVCQVDCNLDESLPTVPCFRDEVNQVILNFIVNAAHAIEDKHSDSEAELGKIHISTFVENDSCIICIEDDGIGMSEEIQKRIFDPFFTTKDVGKGTGQGMSLAYSTIVEKHDGFIEIKSEEGLGTKFKIGLPLHQERFT